MTVLYPNYSLTNLSVGMSASKITKVTVDLVAAFATVTGDTNPIHTQADYAKQSQFKQPIAHGMLTAGFISAVLGTQLPGPGGIYIDQQLRFKAPVFMEDTVVAKVTITDINLRRGFISLQTQCFVDQRLVTTGTATMLVKK